MGYTLLRGIVLVRKRCGGSTFAFQELCYNNELVLVQLFIIQQTIQRCMDRVKQNLLQFSDDVYPFLQKLLWIKLLSSMLS